MITVADSYFETYRTSSDYIRQYVFPGGMLLSNKVIAEQAHNSGLRVRDNFAFGTDYAKTCRIWSERLTPTKSPDRRAGLRRAVLPKLEVLS